jgi:hypothetical protein
VLSWLGQVLIAAALEHLKLVPLWLKHPSGFEEEHVWRIWANFDAGNLQHVCFRAGSATVVSSIELTLSYPVGPDKLPIPEIV